MTHTLHTEGKQTYTEQMQALRRQLNGRAYCRAIKDLLPELTDWQIRNAVNGRGENQLVLAALRLVLHRWDASQKNTMNRLREELEKSGLAA